MKVSPYGIIIIANNSHFTISMDYYTHAVISRGRIIAPDIEFPELGQTFLTKKPT